MLSCKEATRLLSEAKDRDLELGERIQLRIHLSICIGCNRYQRQLDFISLACREAREQQPRD
ncbi:MAG: zf-HC2 domain-containing protein [Betaproteobacteria bacterium]|nr:zf-HC2 domain-containing protein [Betaproteobacteria bacterium]